jgi:hypothetical protein
MVSVITVKLCKLFIGYKFDNYTIILILYTKIWRAKIKEDYSEISGRVGEELALKGVVNMESMAKLDSAVGQGAFRQYVKAYKVRR